MLAILGGGFGLYGYLPAALSLPDTPVVLPERYRPTVRARAELAPFEDRVQWVSGEHEALAIATRVVVARRPQDQQSFVANLANYPNVQSLVLEKPLATSPLASIALANSLAAREMPFRVGYTLARTPWAQRLARLLSAEPGHEVHLQWDFMAKHYLNARATWKRETAAGGGALRFYAVQLIAAMAQSALGAPQLLSSSLTIDAQETARDWYGVLRLPSDSVVHLHVNSHSSAPRFRVHVPGVEDLDLADPFGEVRAANGQDVRVALLADILRAPLAESDFAWSQRVHDVWLAAENGAETTSAVTASFSIPTI